MAIIPFKRKSIELELPEDLLGEKRWLVWRAEDGRKVPYYPTTNRRRSGSMETPEDHAQMTDHAEAMVVLERHVPAYTGLGLAITPGNLLIDLDDVLEAETGRWLDEWAEKFVARAISAGAFVEISHSGSGVHVIGRGHARKAGHKKVNIEVYPSRRFVAITGRLLPGSTCPGALTDCSDLAEEALQEYTRRCEEKGLNGPESALRAPEDRTPPCEVSGTLLDQLNALLGVFSPDDREQWVKTGLALGRAFPGSQEVFTAYASWAKISPNYTGSRDDRTMEDIFFRQAAMPSTSKYTLDTMLRQAEAVGVHTKIFAQDFPDLPLDEEELAEQRISAALSFKWETHALKRDEFINRPPPKEFIVEGFLPKARTAFIGRGGLGKTMLLLYEGLHVAAGKQLYGEFDVLRPGKVLILTAEEERPLLVRRAAALLDELDWEEEEKLQAFESIAVHDVSAKIPRLITQSKAGEFVVSRYVSDLIDGYAGIGLSWLIIDPTAAFGMNEQAMNDSAVAIMEAGARMVEGLNACVTFVHHTSKEGARLGIADAHSGRGGSAFGDASRASRVLTPRNDAAGNSYDALTKTSRLTVHFVKNSYSAPLEPLHLDVIGGFKVNVTDPNAATDERTQLQTMRMRIDENIDRETKAAGFPPSIDTLTRMGGYDMRRQDVRNFILDEINRGRLQLIEHPDDKRKRGVSVNKQWEDDNF